MSWRITHLVIGLLGFVAFIATGFYMIQAHQGLQGMPDGPRVFYRSAHIYLLWSSLLNLMLGIHLAQMPSRVRRWMQAIGSLAVAAGPPMLGVSFFFEPYNPGLLRPIGQLAVFASFAGALLHVLAAIRARVAPGAPRGKA